MTITCGVVAAACLAVLLLVPLAAILWRSLGPVDGSATAGLLAPFADTLGDQYFRGRLAFTLWQALLSTAITVAVGLPTALLFARYAFRGRRLLTAVFTIPFVMPTVVAGIGFLALVGPRGVTGTDLQGTLALVLLAHVFFNFAVVARLVASFLESLAPRLEQAAASLGAGPWRALLRVTLPLALPATLAAAVLVFIFCFTSFGVILILAPGPDFATLEVEIYRLTLRLLSLDTAAVLALAQLVVIGALSHVYTRLQARLAVAVPPAASREAALRRPGTGPRLLLGVDLVVVAALVLAPLLALVVKALTAPSDRFPSLENFRNMLEVPASFGYTSFAASLTNSLKFAGASTALAVLVGMAFAYAVARGHWRWLDQASLLPLAVSPVTLAFGYLITYPLLVTTSWGVPLAHALIAFPFVTRTLLPALRAQPLALAAAAASLGAGPWRSLWRVELPLLRPALTTAAAFAFAISLGEFGASLLLTRSENATLPVAVYTLLGRVGPVNFGAAMALSVVLMLLTAIVMLSLNRRGRGEF